MLTGEGDAEGARRLRKATHGIDGTADHDVSIQRYRHRQQAVGRRCKLMTLDETSPCLRTLG